MYLSLWERSAFGDQAGGGWNENMVAVVSGWASFSGSYFFSSEYQLDRDEEVLPHRSGVLHWDARAHIPEGVFGKW